MFGAEILLVVAAVIIAVVLYLYSRERRVLKMYSELLDERAKLEKLSKQVQLDYYKRRLTEDTLRKILNDYTDKIRALDEKIGAIEDRHGIKDKKTGLERHAEKESVSGKETKETSLGKMEEEIR